jgi:hypothetical protein
MRAYLGYRVYLQQQGNLLVLLLAGGSKKTQQADIAKAKMLSKDTPAESKVECEWRQGRQEAQLLADHFATSSHNNPQVQFFQSFSLSSKGADNSLSWNILRVTPLL